ncbi:hypothetical protein BS50DRAFT_679128 [Corynespora cassiicola Philippines]|uniref:MutL C-terminal dimerisation domain-containing protein n=1 Tax=Corynespora cassiicola Philippines TaxID=1448308 RepID=A0A2T2NER7_CORCC|nr:hypothetical protein BS50DRAFT_679128 [Corynespora cassiicola Philippines]
MALAASSRAILPLPDHVVAQIKSSTAIVSLTGAVLELLKNSLDAGATSIHATVDFGRGGCVVEDNGWGIAPAEFSEYGSLGKPYCTSKYYSDEPCLGRKGTFLASLSAMSLLTIASRHHEYRSHNAITFHHSKTIDRQLPASRQHELVHHKHGTRVTVRNLFGNMPVRVKQRAAVAEQKTEHERLLEGLKWEVVGLMLSWRGSVSLKIRDAENRTLLNLNGSPATPARDSDNKVGKARSTEFQSMLNILTNANYISVDDWASWVPASASTSAIAIKGAISLDPAPTKRVQFISFGSGPLSAESGRNEVYDEVNRIFGLSSFGIVEDDVVDEAEKLRRQSDMRFKKDGYTNRQLTGRKGVDRYPMFHLRIFLRDYHILKKEDRFLDDEANLQAVLSVLNAMVTQWLSVHHFRPRQPRSRRKRPDIGSTPATEPSLEEYAPLSPLSSTSAGPRTSNCRKRKRTAAPTHAEPNRRLHFAEWTRMKSGQADFFDRTCTHGHRLSEDMLPSSYTVSGEKPLHDKGLSPHNGPTMFNAEPILPDSLASAKGNQNKIGPAQGDESDDTFEWTDPVAKKTCVLNARTGCAMPVAPCANQSFPARTGPLEASKSMWIRKKPVPTARTGHSWFNNVLQSWDNPIFKPSEKRIQQISPEDISTHAEGHNHAGQHHCSGLAMAKAFSESSIPDTSKLSKEGLSNASVIAQVDNKFILVRIHNESGPASNSTIASSALVMIDQHAADERIRVEQLLVQLCEPLSTEQAHLGYRSKLGQKSQISFTMLEKPMQFTVTPQERVLYTAHASSFAFWGILYDISTSRTSNGKEQALLIVNALPPSISERCRTDPKLLVSFLRSTVWKYAEEPQLQMSQNGEPPSASQSREAPSWVKRLSTCPQGLLDLVNSRACRSAIMFNDELSLEECRELVQKLSNCAFPFMCAHGRPSMVPLLDLGVAGASDGSSALGLGTEPPGEHKKKKFVEAWKRWQH